MIIFRTRTGFSHNYVLMKYVSIWDSNMGTQRPMAFLPNSHRFIVDISLGEKPGDIEIFTYPHNKPEEELVKLAESKSRKLQDLLDKCKEVHTHRKAFTINLNTLELITENSFSNIYPIRSVDSNIFIFPEGIPDAFPSIFVEQKIGGNSPYTKAIEVMARISQFTMPPVSYGSVLGKKATWILVNSVMNGKFIPEIPSVDGISFPSNGQSWIPESYDTSGLDILREKTKANKLIGKNGRTEDATEDKSKQLEKYLGLEGLASDDMEAKTILNIQRDVLDKNTISFTDMVNVGISEAIKAIPLQHDLIPVVLDYTGVAKKMWVFEGKIHYIPHPDMDDIASFTGTSDEFFVATDVDLSLAREMVSTKVIH